MKKVILAFSGGLDTTFCTIYLKEKGYEVITATVNTGGFSPEDLKQIEEKSKKLGASKHYTVDAKDRIYEDIIQYLIKLNGLYEEDYPLMCADRYIIAEEILKIAEKENAEAVAHGSTAVGNDQVRFDGSFLSLNSGIELVRPIKELGITRSEEMSFLAERGVFVDHVYTKYSVNQNIFGITVSGTEVDENKEPDEGAYQLTKKDGNAQSEYLTLEFSEGVPSKLNGQKLPGIEILMKLNSMLGKYGYGSDIYIGDCIIGIKGRIMFEAPGLLALVEAHRKLEQLVLTKKQIIFSRGAGAQWADLVYSGLYYEPLVKDLESFADSVQKRVTGTVTIKADANRITVVELESPYSLVRKDIAMYAQKACWSAEEANGFIKLHTMQQQLAGIKK
ncbi:MAG: argininosuccinate synthase [Bacillota bacterium]|nr:argininosuccinate synthase [Eubacteriales bacterium]MDD4445056.1 argininosuccinate synthase [Eubacteriales bacterium]MDI9492803.1 argininosuccinate synthase [Bacillota bacterium]HPF18836.1 argininosuccinate synthase [Bacillota bacterium]